jgi:hypothetical protein
MRVLGKMASQKITSLKLFRNYKETGLINNTKIIIFKKYLIYLYICM